MQRKLTGRLSSKISDDNINLQEVVGEVYDEEA